MFSTNILNIPILKKFINNFFNLKQAKNVNKSLLIAFILNFNVNMIFGLTFTNTLPSRTYYGDNYGVTTIKSVNISQTFNTATSGSTSSTIMGNGSISSIY